MGYSSGLAASLQTKSVAESLAISEGLAAAPTAAEITAAQKVGTVAAAPVSMAGSLDTTAVASPGEISAGTGVVSKTSAPPTKPPGAEKGWWSSLDTGEKMVVAQMGSEVVKAGLAGFADDPNAGTIEEKKRQGEQMFASRKFPSIAEVGYKPFVEEAGKGLGRVMAQKLRPQIFGAGELSLNPVI